VDRSTSVFCSYKTGLNQSWFKLVLDRSGLNIYIYIIRDNKYKLNNFKARGELLKKEVDSGSNGMVVSNEGQWVKQRVVVANNSSEGGGGSNRGVVVPKVPLHLAFRAREGVVGQTVGGVCQTEGWWCQKCPSISRFERGRVWWVKQRVVSNSGWCQTEGWWVKQRVVSNGGVVGQTAGGGVIQTWWWPKMTLLLAFRAREMVVVGENPLRHSNREWEGGGGQELQHTSVVSK